MSDLSFIAAGHTRKAALSLGWLTAPARLAGRYLRRCRLARQMARIDPRLLDDAGLNLERYLRG